MMRAMRMRAGEATGQRRLDRRPRGGGAPLSGATPAMALTRDDLPRRTGTDGRRCWRIGPLLQVAVALLLTGVFVVPRVWRMATATPTDASLLVNAAGLGDVDTVRQMLDNGVPADASDSGIVPLMITPSAAVARLLISRGAKVNVTEPTASGSPLTQAITCDRIDVARVLLEAGADPNVRVPRSGLSALESARIRQNDEEVRLLVKYGAIEGALPLFASSAPSLAWETTQPTTPWRVPRAGRVFDQR